ncbi:hypothetical protein D9M69_680680 [compost metagenome]
MRFAARAVEQLVDARTQHEARLARLAIEQVRRPAGDALAVDEQVVVDLLVQRQGAVQAQVDQVQEGLPPHGDHPATALVQAVLDATLQR